MEFEAFDDVSDTMRSKLNQTRRSIERHSGVKGNVFENIVSSFLTDYLPKFIGVSTGFIIDSEGREYKQIDIILFDSNKSPTFFRSKNISHPGQD
jgi:hypothetical protein